MNVLPLEASALRRHCDPAAFPFRSTAELGRRDSNDAQRHAIEALRFGMGIDQLGYNTFVIGSFGLGRRTLVERVLPAGPVRDLVSQGIVGGIDVSEAGVSRMLLCVTETNTREEIDRLVEALAEIGGAV